MQEINQEWFATWFNTPFYHVLYNNRNFDEAEDFIQNLMQHLDLPKDSNVMDLACGKGRHSVFLNKLGYDVTGLDLSENSIDAAKAFENDRLRFNVHDMREVYKENAFDLIVNLFTSFGYFLNPNEQVQVFQSIYDQLRDGGTFVMDYLNVEKAILDLVPNEIKTINGIDFHIQKKIENGFIQKDINFNSEDEDYHFQEFVKVIRLEDFKKIASSIGFDLIDYFGDYQLNVFKKETSPRLILVFKK